MPPLIQWGQPRPCTCWMHAWCLLDWQGLIQAAGSNTRRLSQTLACSRALPRNASPWPLSSGAQALCDPLVVGDAVKRQAPPGQLHDVEPARHSQMQVTSVSSRQCKRTTSPCHTARSLLAPRTSVSPCPAPAARRRRRIPCHHRLGRTPDTPGAGICLDLATAGCRAGSIGMFTNMPTCPNGWKLSGVRSSTLSWHCSAVWAPRAAWQRTCSS